MCQVLDIWLTSRYRAERRGKPRTGQVYLFCSSGEGHYDPVVPLTIATPKHLLQTHQGRVLLQEILTLLTERYEREISLLLSSLGMSPRWLPSKRRCFRKSLPLCFWKQASSNELNLFSLWSERSLKFPGLVLTDLSFSVMFKFYLGLCFERTCSFRL